MRGYVFCKVIAGLEAVYEGEDCGDASVDVGVVRVESKLRLIEALCFSTAD